MWHHRGQAGGWRHAPARTAHWGRAGTLFGHERRLPVCIVRQLVDEARIRELERQVDRLVERPRDECIGQQHCRCGQRQQRRQGSGLTHATRRASTRLSGGEGESCAGPTRPRRGHCRKKPGPSSTRPQRAPGLRRMRPARLSRPPPPRWRQLRRRSATLLDRREWRQGSSLPPPSSTRRRASLATSLCGCPSHPGVVGSANCRRSTPHSSALPQPRNPRRSTPNTRPPPPRGARMWGGAASLLTPSSILRNGRLLFRNSTISFTTSMLLATALLSSSAADNRPNVVWIMADDLDNDWKDDRLAYMPVLRSEFMEQGVFFGAAARSRLPPLASWAHPVRRHRSARCGAARLRCGAARGAARHVRLSATDSGADTQAPRVRLCCWGAIRTTQGTRRTVISTVWQTTRGRRTTRLERGSPVPDSESYGARCFGPAAGDG